MKIKSQTESTSALHIIQKILLTKGHARIAVFLVLAIAMTAIAITSLSLAQSKRKKRVASVSSEQTLEAKSEPSRTGAKRQGGSDLRTRAVKSGDGEQEKSASSPERPGIASDTGKPIDNKPVESRLTKAGRSFDGDLRGLPYEKPVAKERPERGDPPITRGFAGKDAAADAGVPDVSAAAIEAAAIAAAAPAPVIGFEGLDRENWGNGSPPDTNGDVGPNHYIQSVNTSVGIYDKATGARITAFTFNTLMSQGNFGNLCDTDNFGDPVVLYDTFEDRWVLTDFAFKLDANDNVINPPGAFQCFAVSKTSDPVAGGWNFYSINTTGGLGDYPKFGIWPDGLYMTTSMFDYAASGGFQNPRAYAFNKAQMYAGAPTVQVVSFNLPADDFTVLPSNARLQTGTPPAGTPNYYVSTWKFLNGLSVYKFHVDWNSIPLSTFSDETVPLAATSWPNANVANAPQPGTTTLLDTLPIRAMMQNQYTNIGGVESLWNTHTVRRATTTGFAAPRWYQLTVNGGAISSSILQAATWDPDGANVMHRFIPSLAVDRAGNMALGYSTSSSTAFPSIKYAGRLATDPANTFSQTEQTMFAGTASQTGTSRWGDYSTMTIDPDGCTFWFTTQYANPASQTSDKRWKTRIGSFRFPQCIATGNGGTISGTVTANPGGAPLSGATVSLGSRTTTTDASGNYSFSVPAGTYPGMTASFPGRNSTSATMIAVTDGNITTQNFSLTASEASGCLTDTTQADFQTGLPTNVDLTTSPGNVTLLKPVILDQQTTNFTTSGVGFSGTSFTAQTFTPGVTGALQKLEVNIFCASCAGTNPNLTVEVRTTSVGNIVMTAAGLLASSTVPGTSSASGGFMTFSFTTPPTLNAGTVYGFVVRSATTRTTGTQAVLVSNGEGLAGGRRQVCSTTTCANASGQSNDLVFKGYMLGGFSTLGNLVSGAKDANPAADFVSTWGALSWTATTPANTNIRFQAAASNNAAGVFNFVGPDGTANTFFTNGGSLAQFNGFRYLKYKALLTGTSTATPTLADVTICFTDAPKSATTLTVGAATGTYGGTTTLSATLTSDGNPLSSKTVTFTLNGNSFAGNTATTNASGAATVSGVSLSGINAGSYPTGIGATFGGDSLYFNSAGSNSLTIDKATPTITWNNPANIIYGTGLSGTQLNASASVPGGFAYTPAAGTVLHVGNSQSLHVDFTPADATNYNNASKDVSINVTKATLTVKADNQERPYGEANPPLTYTMTGFVNGDTQASAINGEPSITTTAIGTSAPGNYPITAAIGSLTSADYGFSFVNGTLTVTKTDQTINFAALADKTYGDADFTVSATASSGLTVIFTASGKCTISGMTVHLTGAGSCTITASQAGNTNYNPAPNVPQSFNVGKASSTTTVTVSNATYDGQPHGGTAVATGFGGLNQNLTVSYEGRNGTNYGPSTTAPTNAGDYTAAATFNGDADHDGSSDNKNFQIGKATPSIYWNNPANIIYGTALSGTQLNAVAKNGLSVVAGAYLYNPAAGTVLNAGNGQTLSVIFTPTDTTNYNGASKSVSINVGQRMATVTADNKAKQFSDPLPAFTATTTGLFGNDVLGGSVSFNTTATPLSPAGTYPIVPSGSGFNPNYMVQFVNGALTVTQEDATLTYTGDTLLTALSNNTATVRLAAAVQEAQDGYPGNALTGKVVTFSIYKSVNLSMTTPDYTATATISGASNIAVTTISLPADDYSIKLAMVSNLYYTAPVEVAAFTVVVPGTGVASGGGWGTDSNGSRSNFAFTVRYVPSGLPQGNSLYIYRDQLDLSANGAPTGVRDYEIMIKSTAMSALSLSNTTTPATATFTGKNIVIAIDRITGASYNIAAGMGLQFQVDVTDNGEPGSTDMYALRVWNTTGSYKTVGTYTTSGVNTSQLTIGGGNIRVK